MAHPAHQLRDLDELLSPNPANSNIGLHRSHGDWDVPPESRPALASSGCNWLQVFPPGSLPRRGSSGTLGSCILPEATMKATEEEEEREYVSVAASSSSRASSISVTEPSGQQSACFFAMRRDSASVPRFSPLPVCTPRRSIATIQSSIASGKSGALPALPSPEFPPGFHEGHHRADYVRRSYVHANLNLNGLRPNLGPPAGAPGPWARLLKGPLAFAM